MYFCEWQDFWWNNITGPRKAGDGVAEALLSNSTVILMVPADLPWRRPMRSAIEEQIRNNVLKDTIIWIKGVDKAQTSKWLKFCQGYPGS